jgi:hypothetical protein
MSRSLTKTSSQYLWYDGCPVTSEVFTTVVWYNTDNEYHKGNVFVQRNSVNGHYTTMQHRGDAAFQPYTAGKWYGTWSAHVLNNPPKNQWIMCAAIWGLVNPHLYMWGSWTGITRSLNDGVITGPLNQTYIGANGGGVDTFQGLIAEAAIWDKALTDTNFTTLYGGDSAALVESDNLVFYAPLINNDKDYINNWTLTPVNNPTFSSSHPTITYPEGFFSVFGPPIQII